MKHTKNTNARVLLEQTASKEDVDFIVRQVEECSARLREVKEEISKEVFGQDDVIDLTIACMVAGGHLLSEGAPGLGKTMLVSRIARVMGLDFQRTQFTSDLMPADILGSEILHEEGGKQSFQFEPGPIFTQFFMADEINRAGPKVQSALLEAMEEKRVTVSGHTHTLRQPFTVMATQNPVEQAGTYPLPEAQRDRFLLQVDVDYGDEEAEKRILEVSGGTSANIRELFERSANGEDLTNDIDLDNVSNVRAILGQNDLILMQKLALTLPETENVKKAIQQIVRNSRPVTGSAPDIVKNHVEYGASPRAYKAFIRAAKALALMDGRLAPNENDVLKLVKPVLKPRVIMKDSARFENVGLDDVVEALIRPIKKDMGLDMKP